MHVQLALLPLGLSLTLSVSAHATAWHKSMWGFNVTDPNNFPKDPLMQRTFKDWWFHGHLAHPPHQEDWLEFPAGGTTTVEITCDKGASSFFASNPGGDIRSGNDVCPGSGPEEYHTTGADDLKGCAFAIAYIPPSKVDTIQPEDFTIFTVNHTCVWTRFTDFQVPAKMPACPPGGCTCAWFWIHSANSGSEQIYMNGYQCNITGATSNVPIAQPQVARRCGEDIEADRNKPASPANCTYGAKQPLYWLQLEKNNEFEDNWHPPYYNELYHFMDGAQEDIFVDASLPPMTWAGAPTGQLKPMAGTFSVGSDMPAATPASHPHNSMSSPASSAGSSPTSAPDASSDDNSADDSASIGSDSYPSRATDDSSPTSTFQPGSKATPSKDVDTPEATPTPAPRSSKPKGHSKDCKCHKCQNGKKPLTVTRTVFVTTSGSVTMSRATISPEEASKIVADAISTGIPAASVVGNITEQPGRQINSTTTISPEEASSIAAGAASTSTPGADTKCNANSYRRARRSIPKVRRDTAVVPVRHRRMHSRIH